MGCGQLLILDRTNARRKREQADEAGGVALLVHVVLAERDEPLIVQGVLALAADHVHRALVQPERHGARETLLRDVHERVVRLALGRPPASLVHEIGIAGRDEILGRQRAAVEHELLELGVGRVEQGTARRLVHAARLHADHAILDEVDPADAVPCRRSR